MTPIGDAQSRSSRLEAAGVPHSDISIVANNSDSWFIPARKWIATMMGSMIAPKGLARVPGLAQVWAARRVSSRVSACWLYRAWAGGCSRLVAATAVGAAAGAATGGLVGALTQSGVSKEDAPILR